MNMFKSSLIEDEDVMEPEAPEVHEDEEDWYDDDEENAGD
jgi:hypothetical protein